MTLEKSSNFGLGLSKGGGERFCGVFLSSNLDLRQHRSEWWSCSHEVEI